VTKILAALVVVLALTGVPTAEAASPSALAAVGLTFIPGSPGFPVPLIVSRGSTLEFVNLDPLGWHNVSSTIYDENGKPIFGSSEIVGMGSTATVKGVEALQPGVYAFECWIHFGMGGTLSVVD
jgi:plastocyanin